MFHFALVVDARGSRDDGVIAVAEPEERSPLEGDAVLARPVEVTCGVEILLLLRLETLKKSWTSGG